MYNLPRSVFIHTILGLGTGETREDLTDAALNGQDIRDEYNRSQDHNSGMPRSLCSGIMALLDGPKTRQVGRVPIMPKSYNHTTDNMLPNTSTQTNPYEILLSTSGGQYVEVSTLASYLGTGVHISAAVNIKSQNENVGDGFSDNSGDFQSLRDYVATVPPLCRSLGTTMVDSVGNPNTISSVETMM